MSRSLKKGAFTHPSLLSKVAKKSPGDRQPIKTWSRASVILPEMVGFVFGVHNGRHFIEVLITEDHVGHRLGEFAPTRKFVKHGGRLAKETEATATSNQGKR